MACKPARWQPRHHRGYAGPTYCGDDEATESGRVAHGLAGVPAGGRLSNGTKLVVFVTFV